MGRVISQSTIKLKSEFMIYHNDGKSISEIAEIFGVSSRSIYSLLQEIADENNVTRESLLERVHKKHIRIASKNSAKKREKVDTKELIEGYKSLLNDIDLFLKK